MPREPNGVPGYPTRLQFQGWSSVDPTAALSWLQNNPGDCIKLLQNLAGTCPDVAQNLDSLLAQTVRESTTTSLNTMGNWLNQNPDHPLRDQTLVHFVNQCRADDPEAAARWANSIKDETLRAAALQRLQPTPERSR